MFCLGRGDPARCRDLLTRALELASDTNIVGEDRADGTLGRDSEGGDSALQVLTLNNTACLHRRYSGSLLRLFVLSLSWNGKDTYGLRAEFVEIRAGIVELDGEHVL